MGRILESRPVATLLGAFAAATFAWIAWALATPGDYFGNGSVLILPSLGGAIVGGGAVGLSARSGLRRVLAVAAVLGLGYWLFAPSHWWVHPPPGPPGAATPSR